ncbi:MAG: hypothetical protein AABY75_00640 [Bacteroidota bacterium]
MNRRAFLTAAAGLPTTAAWISRLEAAAPLAVPVRSASMWTYLWDIVDEGYDTPLQLLKENGLTHVSLAAAYHAGRFLLPHNPRRKVYFLEDGTVYYEPTPSLYGTVKPLVNSYVKSGHHFGSVRRAAEREGLGASAWVVCCHNTPLGTAYPSIACVNAFGDPMPHNLCPSSNDLRRYLRGVVCDLASQRAQRIELEAMQFQGYAHGFHHEREGFALTPAHRFLLGLCFCPSCFDRSTPSVDLVPIQRYVRKTLEDYFADPPSTTAINTLADLPQDLFAPLVAWRKDVVVSLAEELQDVVAKCGTELRPLVSLDPIARDMVGMDVARVAAITGGVLMPGYVKDGSALRPVLGAVQSAAKGQQVIVGFQVGLPESGGKEEFLSRMAAARDMGVRDFNFYNYGFIPLENLEWIRKGVEG